MANGETNSAEFKFYLNRQGLRGRQGVKGDKGFSPSISVGKDTASEYTLKITNETGSFETTNLREHKEDRSGTYVRYDRNEQVMYLGVADSASTTSSGEVRFATDEEITNGSESTVISPANMQDYVSAEIALVDKDISDMQAQVDIIETSVTNLNGKVQMVEGEVNTIKSTYQPKNDTSLTTTDKTVVGAINEINSGLSNKLTVDNIIAGENVTVSKEGNNVTISSTGGSGDEIPITGNVEDITGIKSFSDGYINFDVPNVTGVKIANQNALTYTSADNVKYRLRIGEGEDIDDVIFHATPKDKEGNAYITGVNQATAETLGSIKANAKQASDTQEVRIDTTTGFLYTAPGSAGTTDYNDLSNKPQVNSVELSGNKTLDELGIQAKGDYALKSDVEELGNEVNQLANDVTNVETSVKNLVTLDTEQTVSGNKTFTGNVTTGAIEITGNMAIKSLDNETEYTGLVAHSSGLYLGDDPRANVGPLHLNTSDNIKILRGTAGQEGQTYENIDSGNISEYISTTGAYTKAETDKLLDEKQDKLVAGNNISLTDTIDGVLPITSPITGETVDNQVYTPWGGDSHSNISFTLAFTFKYDYVSASQSGLIQLSNSVIDNFLELRCLNTRVIKMSVNFSNTVSDHDILGNFEPLQYYNAYISFDNDTSTIHYKFTSEDGKTLIQEGSDTTVAKNPNFDKFQFTTSVSSVKGETLALSLTKNASNRTIISSDVKAGAILTGNNTFTGINTFTNDVVVNGANNRITLANNAVVSGSAEGLAFQTESGEIQLKSDTMLSTQICNASMQNVINVSQADNIIVGDSSALTTVYSNSDIKAVINGGTETTVTTELDLQAVKDEVSSTTGVVDSLTSALGALKIYSADGTNVGCTQAQYDAIQTKDRNTLYLIIEEEGA